MAIEQYDELETRHTFLTTQRKDLVESIAQTSEAIKRIDMTTRERFITAFAAINRNFQEMFTTLFGGGRAGLTLLDENDPLESGIEIVAQPPGKRLQSVQLLSGGEKALTAISLMFGLFQFKPSPFCLLDEIDAPLDDANIGRFVGMLRAMQSHTQFILITHNRKTMEIADRLYGVTMEEPGVSKLISVDLNQGPGFGLQALGPRVGKSSVTRVCLTWLVAAALSAGCRPVDRRTLEASFTDSWTRSYPFSAGGEFQIVGGEGSVDVEGGAGSTVEVRANASSRRLPSRWPVSCPARSTIREDIAPDRIVIQTEGLRGIVIGVEVRVDYHVTVPEQTRVRVRASNGSITVTGVNGRVAMNSANGPITGTRLGGGVEARGVNQKVVIDLARFSDAVEVRAVNGSASLTLPSDTDATLTATTANGRIDLGTLTVDPIGEQTPRRIRGRLGAGGPPIDVHAVNGSVTIAPRP